MSNTPTPKATPQLRITDPAGVVTHHPFNEAGRVSVGRALDNDLAISSHALSRHHAYFQRGPNGQIGVYDLGSKNGVFLNGARIETNELVIIVSGDVVDICGFLVRLVTDEEEASDELAFLEETGPHSTSLTIDVIDASEIRSKLLAPTQTSRTATRSGEIPMADILSAAVDLIDTRDIGEVRERVLDFVGRIVGFDAGYLLTWDAEAGDARVDASRSLRMGRDKKPAISRSIIGDAARSKKPVLLLDASSDDRYDASQSIAGLGITSAIAAPMLADDDEVLSIIYVTRFGVSGSFTQADGHVLAYVAAVAALRFQNARLIEEALRTRFLEGELSVAAKIQSALLRSSPPGLVGYEVCEGYIPCRITSGDFYDFVPLGDGRLAFALGDVSGKGVGAAMLMFSAVTVLRTLMGELADGREFHGLLSRANLALSATMVEGRFATALAGCLEPETGRVIYSNAAQGGMVLRASGEQESLDYHGTPLGMFEDASYSVSTIVLAPGDILYLYSDGLSEARSADGSFFGDGRIAEILAEHRGRPVREIASRIEEALASFVGSSPRHDDTTFMIFKRVKSDAG